MIKIDVRGIESVQRQLDRVSDRFFREAALGAALNKTADKAKAEINRQIVRTYAIKAADVRSSVRLARAIAKKGLMEARIEVFGSPSRRGRSMNLIHFMAAGKGGAQVSRGVKKKELGALDGQIGFRIKRSGGLKTKPGVFVGNKGRTIFQRTGGGRTPIEAVSVIGVSQMFNSRAIYRSVIEKINKELPVEVSRAVERELGRKAR